MEFTLSVRGNHCQDVRIVQWFAICHDAVDVIELIGVVLFDQPFVIDVKCSLLSFE
jgi:hypothetical protein